MSTLSGLSQNGKSNRREQYAKQNDCHNTKGGLLPLLILVLGLSPVVPAAKNNFISFDFPGSSNTQATAIAPSGEIVGRYIGTDGQQHGFILRQGVLKTFDIPGAVFTDIAWANTRGDLVGTYVLSDGLVHAYVMRGRTLTTIDFPANQVNTNGFGISNAGEVVGVEWPQGNFFVAHGYLFRRGEFTLIDFPGAMGTFPTMIIDSRRNADTNLVVHGFFFDHGSFRTIDFPESTLTWITGVNPQGDIVGFYNSQDGKQHGFVFGNGGFTSIDIPGAIATEANGINARGNVVGTNEDVLIDTANPDLFQRCDTVWLVDRWSATGSKPQIEQHAQRSQSEPDEAPHDPVHLQSGQ